MVKQITPKDSMGDIFYKLEKRDVKSVKDILLWGKKNAVRVDVDMIDSEKEVTKFGTSAKIDAPKRYIGKRAYVIILKK